MPLSATLPFIADPSGLASNVFLFDDFMGNTIDPDKWDTSIGAGATVALTTPDSTDDGGVVRLATGATSGTVANMGLDGNVKPYRLGERAFVVFRSRIIDDIQLDWAVGISNVAVAAGNLMVGTTTNKYALYNSAGASAAIFQLITSDGAAESTDNSSITGGTGYRDYLIDPVSSSRIELYINSKFDVARAAQIPSATTMLGSMTSYIRNASGVNKELRIDLILIYMNRA